MFKIGDFSRLGQVSTRMLRHYDQLGLLKPKHTDKFSGYRYYTIDQLGDLNRIIALKELGLSLEQIAQIMGEAKPLNADKLRGMLMMNGLRSSSPSPRSKRGWVASRRGSGRSRLSMNPPLTGAG